MPGIGSQNYGSEPPVASHDEPVATNHLDGLQWGKSGLEMDEERKQQIAYEYLCRLEEARVWISKCIDEELPPVGNGVLEDSLHNGVHLAKLAASISPHIVQERRIFDSDQRKYQASGLHFRHTDNINFFLRAATDIGLPEGCSQYFPESDNNDSYKSDFSTDLTKPGKFCVTELDTILFTDDYIEKEFLLQKLEEKEPGHYSPAESRHVRHLQFKTWPNYGVPEAVKPIFEFIVHVYNRMNELKDLDQDKVPQLYLPRHGNPNLLVHCSGGIGRSGTFLTAFHHYWYYMDVIGKKLPFPKAEGICPVSLQETVHFMRLQRHPWMVEGDHQYALAYDIIIHLLRNKILISKL